MEFIIYRRPYRVRRAAKRGKEITIPPETFKTGDVVTAYYADFVLYVPAGVTVDEELLKRAIKTKR